jgi:hypothetical protein
LVRREVPGRGGFSYVAIAIVENLVSDKISFRIVIKSRCRAQIRDHRSHDVRRGALRIRVTVCLHAKRHQTEDGKQTKGRDTQGEGQLDKRKRVNPPQAEYHFL